MPRRARVEFHDAVHHVTAKSPTGRLLFIDDDDRQRYLALIAREIRERRWRLLTFCLLSNHLHLLVQTPEPDLGLGLKRAHEDFARHINRRHAQHGHLFGARFYNGIVATERHVVGCLRYIARNPVEAGICRKPREWAWSAHRALAGLVDPPSFLDVGAAYDLLDADASRARVEYVRLVAQSDQTLLAGLPRPGSDAWLLAARDDFSIPMSEVATFLGLGLSTAYRRLSTARENEGTVPRFSGGNEGTVPSFSDGNVGTVP